jgi:excinuclease UvrABC nuclease subunit
MAMRNNEQEILIRYVRKELPERPGVYLFRDRAGNIAYIGKSVNLRKRVLSYFYNKGSHAGNKIRPLVSCIEHVEFHETPDEFIALLLEDKLIKKYYPFYNVRQKKFKKYKYLLITDGLFPTVKIIDSLKRIKNKSVYGPFQGKAYVDTLLDIILKYFNMRPCKELNPVTKCLYHDLKYCPAPCILNIMPIEYTAIVNKVQDFLAGNTGYIIPLLTAKLNRYIFDVEFEYARDIQRQIDFLNSFSKKQKFFNKFRHGKLEIYERSNGYPSYIFSKGRLRICDSSATNKITESDNRLLYIDNEFFNDPRIMLDRANIVFGWLNNKVNNYRYFFSN